MSKYEEKNCILSLQLLVLFLSIFVSRYGSYRIIIWSFYFKICSAFLMFLIGAQHTHIMVLFFVLDRYSNMIKKKNFKRKTKEKKLLVCLLSQ